MKWPDRYRYKSLKYFHVNKSTSAKSKQTDRTISLAAFIFSVNIILHFVYDRVDVNLRTFTRSACLVYTAIRNIKDLNESNV